MMNKYLLDDRSGTAGKTWRMSPPSHLRAAAVAVAVVLGAFGSLEAQALSLGRVTVLSALGEPLRAEIEIPQITAEEAASLKTGIPNPAAFRAAGVEYNPALAGAAITLHQRPDGRSYLRLVSDKTVSEPFVDLILEAQWSSGRLVRDYTLLFDPPSMRSPAPLAAGAPQVSTPLADSPTPGPQTPRGTPAPAAAPVASPAKPSRPSPERTVAAAPAKGLDAGGKTLKVQAGDTAGRIAAANKPTEVSLDQMLVALLRTNPDAFINGNINRIKAGALIEIPTAEQVSNVPAGEARQLLSVQSANFNEFRRRLADAAPAQPVSAADRQASGRVQPNIEERKTATASPDKLTLSKGSVKGAAPEAQIAQARQGKEEKERVAELSKNISELSRLQDKAAATGAASPASASRGPTVAVGSAASAPKAAAPATSASAGASAPAASAPPAMAASAISSVKPGTATAPLAAASTAASVAAVASAAKPAMPAPAASAPPAASSNAASASAVSGTPAQPAASTASATGGAPAVATTAAPASAPASAPAPKPKVAAVKPPPPEPSLLDDLLENPVVPAAAGGLLALLAGLAFYRARQRKKSSQVDSSFLESRMQPDSFFGSSGGQRIDTADEAPTGSSLAYSPSQLDAAGDVDPVAEADVYLAYGRDLQAEEILKEALRMNPSRIAIHGKLLEIFAKRRDVRAFEALAGDAFKLCAGEGAEWERICEFGRELDQDNPLYQPGGRPKNKAGTADAKEPVAPFFASSTIPVAPHPHFAPSSSMPVDLDLGDLSFDSPNSAPIITAAAAQADPVEGVISGPVPLDVELGWDALATPTAEVPSTLPVTTSPVSVQRASLPTAPQIAAESEMIEFDLGSLSLDLDRSMPANEMPAPLPSLHGSNTDPLETKMALAQEFQSIGDSDGARTLVEEVVAHASGPLKAKAQRFLAELG